MSASKKKKPTIVLTFQKEGKNGGPYVSHKRILESGLREIYDFVPLYIPRTRELIKPATFQSLVHEINSVNADIFQFTGLQLEGYTSLKLGKAAGVPTICAIRGSTDEAVLVNPLLRKVVDYCEKKTLKEADACYAVSNYVANWEKTKKYANNMYGHIYNFFDFTSNTKCLEDRKVIRRELNIKKDEIVIVSTGRIILEKGYGTVKDIIISGSPWRNVKFLIVGEGNYKEEFEATIADNGLNENVLFLGYRNDISAILNASDIYLSCTWHETFGNSIIEGSYHALPVVASNVGGVPEIIEDGYTGFLVAPKDVDGFLKKLEILIQDEKLRRDIGTNGLSYVTKKFDPTDIENRLHQLYQSVLKRKEDDKD